MIEGIIAFIGACKKSDDDSSSTTTASTPTSCSDTASGSITGIDNQSVSGTYSVMLQYAGNTGIDNDTGCTTNADIMAGFSNHIAGGAASFNYWKIVTSDTTYAVRLKSFTDTACSSSAEMASLVIGYTDVTIGDNVTGLTTGNASNGTTGTKATSKQHCMKGKGTTDNGTAWLNAYVSSSGITYVTGEEKISGASGETYYHLWHSDNSSKSQGSGGYSDFLGNAWRQRSSSSGYPTDWTDSSAQDVFQR